MKMDIVWQNIILWILGHTAYCQGMGVLMLKINTRVWLLVA